MGFSKLCFMLHYHQSHYFIRYAVLLVWKKVRKIRPKTDHCFPEKQTKNRPIFTKKKTDLRKYSCITLSVNFCTEKFSRGLILAWIYFRELNFSYFAWIYFLQFYIFWLFRDRIFRYNYCISIVFGGKNLKSRLEVQKEDQKQTKIAKTSA